MIKKYLLSPTVYGLCMVTLMWQILSMVVASNVIPTPLSAISLFTTLLPTVLSKHILYSIYRIALSLFFALLIGIPLGLLCGLIPKVDKYISPITYILYPLPKVAFLPLFMIFLGIGDASKVVLMVSVIVFQVMLAIRDGVKAIPKELFLSMYSLGLSKLQLFQHLIFPAMLPRLFSAVRISLGMSIATLFFAENFATTYGLGYLVMNAWSMVDYEKMFAGIIALSLLGLVLFKIIDKLEHKYCPWLANK